MRQVLNSILHFKRENIDEQIKLNSCTLVIDSYLFICHFWRAWDKNCFGWWDRYEMRVNDGTVLIHTLHACAWYRKYIFSMENFGNCRNRIFYMAIPLYALCAIVLPKAHQTKTHTYTIIVRLAIWQNVCSSHMYKSRKYNVMWMWEWDGLFWWVHASGRERERRAGCWRDMKQNDPDYLESIHVYMTHSICFCLRCSVYAAFIYLFILAWLDRFMASGGYETVWQSL